MRPTSASAFTSLYLDDEIFVAAVLIVAIVVTRIGTIAVRRLQRQMEAAQRGGSARSRSSATTSPGSTCRSRTRSTSATSSTSLSAAFG